MTEYLVTVNGATIGQFQSYEKARELIDELLECLKGPNVVEMHRKQWKQSESYTSIRVISIKMKQT